jgi:glutamate-1-semialdehyde 2,1-aminomutase
MARQLEANRTERSEQCFERARKVLVGGVNSPVRAFREGEGRSVFLCAAEGPCVIDADGNRYVDLVGSWGRRPRPRTSSGEGLGD